MKNNSMVILYLNRELDKIPKTLNSNINRRLPLKKKKNTFITPNN